MKIGFLINPIAGLGGKVGLKGTDNDLVIKAKKLNAIPIAPERAKLFLNSLATLYGPREKKYRFFIPNGIMGYDFIKEYSFNHEIIDYKSNEKLTTAQDTKNIIKIFENRKVDLIIFVGGDGTSADIFKSIENNTPILGIPSGVKTYGAVFSHNPEEAVSILESFYENRIVKDAEIMDLDEEKYLSNIIDVTLIGYVKVPAFPEYLQQSKERIEYTEEEGIAIDRITDELLDQINSFSDNTLLIIGPGTTFKTLFQKMNIKKTFLGVDCIIKRKKSNYEQIVTDAREDQIIHLLNDFKIIKIIVTVLGGLGFIFGRGNHQISSEIINNERISKEDIIIVATKQKLESIKQKVLRVDFSNKKANQKLIGYMKVITDRGEMRMMKVVH